MSADNPFQFDPWKLINIVWGALCGFAIFFAKRGVNSFDEVKRQQALLVSREELSSRLDQLHSDRMRMHHENLEAMREIRQSVERVHQRVDQVFTRQDR